MAPGLFSITTARFREIQTALNPEKTEAELKQFITTCNDAELTYAGARVKEMASIKEKLCSVSQCDYVKDILNFQPGHQREIQRYQEIVDALTPQQKELYDAYVFTIKVERLISQVTAEKAANAARIAAAERRDLEAVRKKAEKEQKIKTAVEFYKDKSDGELNTLIKTVELEKEELNTSYQALSGDARYSKMDEYFAKGDELYLLRDVQRERRSEQSSVTIFRMK